MDEIDINAMFDEFNQTYFGGEIPKIPVLWNNRLRTTGGRCHYRWVTRINRKVEPYKIDLSNRLFENNDWDIDKVKRTLIHEMTHAYCVEKYGERGHGYWFQRTMTLITGELKNHRCHNYDTSGLKEERNIEAVCPCCNIVLAANARMPAKGRQYIHRDCGNTLIFRRAINVLKTGISLAD